MQRTISQLLLLSTIGTCLYAADTPPSATAPATNDEEALPDAPARDISRMILDQELNSLYRFRMLAGCKVQPLSDIEDPEVLAFRKKR